MTVFAIDPGPHTAIFWNLPDGDFRVVTLDFTIPHELPSHLRLYNWLESNVGPSDTIVCESFEYRKEDSKNREYIDYSTGEYVGTVKLYAQLTCTYYVMQSASTGKGFWVDAKLKQIGLYKFLKDRHQRDAARHWFHYRTFTQNDQEWLHKLR